jgi:hypothetical protein
VKQVVKLEIRYQHDLAVTNVMPLKTVAGQGFNCHINVTVENQGVYTETFNLTLYANATVVAAMQNLSLVSITSTTITFVWNTTAFAYGNYTISAYASQVSGEIVTADNTLIDGWVIMTIPGDVKFDKTVNVLDLILIANHLGHTSGDGHVSYTKDWYDCMNTDINNDNQHNVLDLIITANHLGQTWP